jgi:predicted ester cyclase
MPDDRPGERVSQLTPVTMPLVANQRFSAPVVRLGTAPLGSWARGRQRGRGNPRRSAAPITSRPLRPKQPGQRFKGWRRLRVTAASVCGPVPRAARGWAPGQLASADLWLLARAPSVEGWGDLGDAQTHPARSACLPVLSTQRRTGLRGRLHGDLVEEYGEDAVFRDITDMPYGVDFHKRLMVDEFIHPDFVNDDAHEEPPGARKPGPEGFTAKVGWLRGAFADLDFELEDAVACGDKVVLRVTERGRHEGLFTVYEPDSEQVGQLFPPTHRSFTTTETHIFRIDDNKLIEHRANRDDLGMAIQLGWIPPRPTYIARIVILRVRRRLQQRS